MGIPAPRRLRPAAAAAAALLLATVAACGDSSSDSGGGGAAGSGIDTAPVVIAWNSTPDESYLPLLVAVDSMKKQGYRIEAKQLSGSDVSFQGLATNQIQFTADSLPPGALSGSKGAPVKAVGTRNANLVVWVARPQYADCAALSGKPVGIYSETGGYTVLMKLYFQKHCPDVKPQYIAIPDSPLRAQAVASGRIEGTALGLPDAVALQAKYAGQKLAVVPLREELPGVGDEYVYTNEQTLAQRRGIVTALLQAQLKAIRDIYANPASLDALVKQHLPNATDATVAKQFVETKIWYANGGLSGPGLPNTLKAFSLPGSPDDLQDQGPLKDALAALGGNSPATEY